LLLYSSTPLLHYSTTPLLHYSTTPLLHYPTTPLPHYATTLRYAYNTRYIYYTFDEIVGASLPEHHKNKSVHPEWRRLDQVHHKYSSRTRSLLLKIAMGWMRVMRKKTAHW
ncbi:hypothetical protein Agub_g1316, partial [Astrephomene gubernaculifera]